MAFGNTTYITALSKGVLIKRWTIFIMILSLMNVILPFFAVEPPDVRADGFSQARENWRAWAGIEIFPAFLAADKDISQKISPDGKLHLTVIYSENIKAAREMSETLERRGRVKNIPISATAVSGENFSKGLYKNTAGAYISESLTNLSAVIHYSSQKGLLLFSPFEEDVEKGVPVGLYISDRITPYLNPVAIDTYGIRLKSFFVRISETYGKTQR